MSTLSISRIASSDPAECGTEGSSNSRTTCASASASRSGTSDAEFFSRSFCRPPISTYSIVAYVIFFGLNTSASFTTRASGTRAIPICAWFGVLRASTRAFVRMRNKLVFPTCGSPIIPVCISFGY